jgi:hypothetical protein
MQYNRGIGIVFGLLFGMAVISLNSPSTAAPPAKETASGTHTQNWDRSFPSAAGLPY